MNDAQVKEGDVLSGKFKVERVLGRGGMGVVVAARHLQLQQRVALKFMLPEAMVTGESVERFLREARAAARLRSEHVARVLDVGTLDTGAPYIVMELLEGKDVATLMDHGPLPVGQAVAIIIHACAAVAEAHAIHIIHRDLKLRNLFLTEDVEGKPLVKVLDFGISKDLGADPLDPSSGGGLTKTSMMLGSPHYMSPEQLKSSKDVDARADVWSLGVCLFELLTKQMPFSAASIAELCVVVLSQKAPSLRQFRPDVPPELEAIVMRCLEKQPGDRFQSVADLATALEPFADPWGRDAAARARNVMRNSRQTASPVISPVVSGASPTGGTMATGPTVATWDVTNPKKKPSRTVPILAGAGAATLLLVGIGVGLALRREPPKPTVAPPPPVSETVVAVTPSAKPTASVTASVTASATATVTATAAPTHVSTPKPKPTAKPSDDDEMLSGRH